MKLRMLGPGHSKAEPAEFNARNKCSERNKFIKFNCGLALALRQGHVFGYVNELNSGLPLALSPGQARIKLIRFIKLIIFGRLGPGFSQTEANRTE